MNALPCDRTGRDSSRAAGHAPSSRESSHSARPLERRGRSSHRGPQCDGLRQGSKRPAQVTSATPHVLLARENRRLQHGVGGGDRVAAWFLHGSVLSAAGRRRRPRRFPTLAHPGPPQHPTMPTTPDHARVDPRECRPRSSRDRMLPG
jgi:hypothetical protein